ncbi:hypothetical protein R0137_11210 [Congregibacter brevis]|uniref:Uncharacterized protein n=1 Tax=Congregibacter brevis TaxID=3081201 RepID=A0ABZ0I9Q9_9GAMM|nr:hypothetical protein R0137_11210 [Congregibacter sp. IMCC45268]
MTETEAQASSPEDSSAVESKVPSRSMKHSGLLKSTVINGWPLFWLLSLTLSAFTLIAMSGIDMSSPDGVSHMISRSVRWAVPFIYLVLASAAVPVLFPSAFTHWWSRNRRYLGLVFAVAMAWQGTFIFILSNLHSSYYYEDVYYLRDELEGSSGYLFLAAMVLTSFRFGRRHLTGAQWKVLHRCGVYFLWAYPFSVYWWALYYYGHAESIDYFFYWMGFLAFLARIAAWGKRRATRSSSLQPEALHRSAGILLIILGLSASATGGAWQASVTEILTGPAWSANLELWLPFWPLEPFLPLFAIGIGTWLFTGAFENAESYDLTRQ